MPLPFLCKAVYFSFLDDKSTIITSDIKIPRTLIADMVEVQNLSIDTNGVEVSLPIANYDSAYMGTQNCLLLSKDKADEILIYHITNYQFKGGYMVIKADNTPYTINKTQVTTDNQYYTIKNQIPKDAISTFIEWGYAHDSICSPDGTLNIGYTSNDIYHSCYNGNCEITNKRFKLAFDICNNDNDSQYINDNVLYWVYFYIATGEYKIADFDDESFNKATLNGSDFDGLTQPYSILCLPIYKYGVTPFIYTRTVFTDPDDPTISKDFLLSGLSLTLFREYNKDTALFYSVKITNTPPSPIFNYIREDDKIIILSAETNAREQQYNSFALQSGEGVNRVRQGFIICQPNSSTPYKTIPITNDELQQYGYPVGTKINQYVSKTKFYGTTNPYISLHTTRLRLRNATGDEYDYLPIELGLFNEICFNFYDPRTIDNTTTFMCVDTTTLYKSVLTQETVESYKGLLTTNTNDLIYSTDLLAEYLANNKNAKESFYLRKNLSVAQSIATGVMNVGLGAWGASMNPMVGQQIISGIQATGGANSALWGIINGIGDTVNFKRDLDNLASTKDKLNYTNNTNYLGQSIIGLGFYLEIVTIPDYKKEILYNEFIDKGIKLSKYIPNESVENYLTISDYAYDKKSYKYIQANGLLKNKDLYNSKQLLVYQNYLVNGVRMIKTNDIVISDEPTNQDSVLQNINEEEIS